jgi:hypothetical protein
MTEHIVSAKKPELRRFAQLMIEFVERVFKDDVLADLDYVVLFSTHMDDRWEAYRMAKRTELAETPLIGLLKELAKFPITAKGIYYGERGCRTVICMISGEADDTYALAHEMAHHALFDHKHRLVRSFRRDLPEVDELVSKAVYLRSEYIDGMVRAADELAVNYVVFNHFYCMNTRPATSLGQLLSEVGVARYHVDDVIHMLEDWASDVRGLAEKYRAMPLVAIEYRNYLKLIEGAIRRVKSLTDLPNLIKTSHSVFAGSVKRWPKDVYLSDPERYGALFTKVISAHRRELVFDGLRRKGIPTFE